MTAPAAMQADFVDLKFVKGRKVMQVILELPIEAGAKFVEAFGTPNPSSGVPVAIARLDPNAKPEKPKGGKLAMRAGILCNEGGFIRYLSESYADTIRSNLEDGPWEPAALVRQLCGVESRADLDHNEKAACKFLDLEASYKAWLTVPA